MTEHTRKCAVVLCLVGAWAAAHAEVSVDVTPDGRVHPIILAHIVDGPDPIGVFWTAYRIDADERILNAAGYDRGDGRPDLAVRPDGSPVAVWAYNAGPNHDIALSEWTGAAWGPIEFITAGPEDALDPRVFISTDGSLYIVWWIDDVVDRVMLASRPAGSALWTAPVQVTPPMETGRRPSVVLSDGVLRVAYERDTGAQNNPLEAVIVRQESGSGFTQEFAAASARSDALDALLHFERGSLWLDWKQESADFGSTESISGGWCAPQQSPWTSPNWVGVEETRKQIRNQVLVP